jgi:hypothetical protein
MSKVNNNEVDLGGPYMVQDHDHMSDSQQNANKANRGKVRQADQSQPEARQQGGSDRKSEQRRQAH